MSDFTVEVRRICEMSIGLTEGAGFSQVENVIQSAIPFIFDFDFPIFDETYRNVLETKILRHFYMREIGYETIGRWKLALSDRLNVIMPYYNQLYKSELLEFNPLYDVDVTRDHTSEGDGNRTTNGNTTETESYQETTSGTTNTTTEGSSENQQTSSGTESTTSDTESINKYLDTPQGSITDLTNSDWLTNLSQVNGSSTVDGESSGTVTDNGSTTGKSDTTQSSTRENTGGKTGSSSGTETFKNTENYLEHVVGKQGGGTFSEMLIAYRKTFLNIDSMVLNELEDLFMLLW